MNIHRGSLLNSPSSGADDRLLKQSIASIKDELRMELQQQLHDVDRRIEDAYKKGRQDAELKELQLWIPPVDPRLVERAKGLEFIDLSEIKASYNKVTKSKDAKERLVVDKQTGDIVVEEGASQDRDTIKWMEWQSLFADLLDLYLIHGGHLKHLPAMLSYFRLFQRMGQGGKFTFMSLQKLDRHIRSKPEGQGPNFSWRCDGTMSNVLYLDGFKGHAADKTPSAKKQGNKKRAASSCFQWMQGKDCSFGDTCKYPHACSACGITAPKKHVLETCTKKSAVEAGLKKKKSRFPASN